MALGEGRYFLGYLVAKSYPILQILTLFQFKIYHFFHTLLRLGISTNVYIGKIQLVF